MAIINWIQHTEPAVGAGDPFLADVINRPLRALVTLAGLNPDADIGTGFSPYNHTHTSIARLATPYDAGNYPRVANVNLDGTMCLVGFDCTAAARTATLPPVASFPGIIYTVFKIDVSANQLILAAQGGEFISGAASKNTAAQWGKIQVQSNGVIWIQLI